MNYLQWCSTILTLLIIPFRVMNHPGQWIVASMGYVFHGLKLTEYTSLFQWVALLHSWSLLLICYCLRIHVTLQSTSMAGKPVSCLPISMISVKHASKALTVSHMQAHWNLCAHHGSYHIQRHFQVHCNFSGFPDSLLRLILPFAEIWYIYCPFWW